MLHFDSDYMEGAHPLIMERMMQTNLEQTVGYGMDPYTRRAVALIQDAVGSHFADVHFLIGGTQSNATVIGALLHGSDAVIAADTAHINVHEAGAIEATGHKVIPLPAIEGKLSAARIEQYLENFFKDDTWAHMSIPAMVYISFPTEYGTIYSKAELEAISGVCKRYSLKLFVDGARLGYGLAAKGNDVTLKDLFRCCDAFYIGGTKVGTMFGEAVVLKSKSLVPNFFSYIKRSGAMLAKGRLLGLQFETMFTDDLYLKCGRNGVDRAMELREAFESCGYKPAIDSPTNQQFFELPNSLIDNLSKDVTFEFWGPRGKDKSIVRFVTSWATPAESIEKLKALLNNF